MCTAERVRGKWGRGLEIDGPAYVGSLGMRWCLGGRLIALGLAFGLAGPALAFGPEEVADLATFVRSFAARFRFSGDEAEERARLEAIDACVDEMSFIARPFARSRLRKATEISREIAFDVSEAVLAIEESDEPRKTVPLTGRPVAWRSPDGEDLRLSLRRAGERLILRSEADEGGEERVLRLSPDGRRLTIDVTIFADRLPEPIHYRLTYHRLGLERSGAAEGARTRPRPAASHPRESHE